MEDTGEERLLDAAEEQARAEEVAASLSTLFLSAWEDNQEQALEAIQASLRQGDGAVGEDDIQRFDDQYGRDPAPAGRQGA